ncbi:Flagellar calcium-binding protein [Diplonema papillatum]|nr:Flagellar calcium-binding protein [Diplonema papillatum]
MPALVTHPDMPYSQLGNIRDKVPLNYCCLKLPKASGKGKWDNFAFEPTTTFDEAKTGLWGNLASTGPIAHRVTTERPHLKDVSFANWEVSPLPSNCRLSDALSTIAQRNVADNRVLKYKIRFADASELTFARKDPEEPRSLRYADYFCPNRAFEKRAGTTKSGYPNSDTFLRPSYDALVDIHGHRLPAQDRKNTSATVLPVLPKGRAKQSSGFPTFPTADERRDLFDRLDPNGNGLLSLAELDRGVVTLWPEFNQKPAIMRAYKAADVNGSGLLGRKEFKYFLKYLQYYVGLWKKFRTADTSGDRRVTLKELQARCHALGLSMTQVNESFTQMDGNKGGFVLFDEFAMWMAKHRVDRQLGPLQKGAQTNASRYRPKVPAAAKSQSSSVSRASSTRNRESGRSFGPRKQKLTALSYPTAEARSALFDRIDPNGNGVLSLAELDKAVVELWPEFNHKPALMRAYAAADKSGNGWIGKREFKFFLAYIVRFVELWNTFCEIDTSDDRRISKEELNRVRSSSVFANIDVDKAFAAMDKNKGGYVLFEEFCAYMAEMAASD